MSARGVDGSDDGRGASDGEGLEVLVLTPIGRDAELAGRALARAGMGTRACEDLVDLAGRVDEDAGAGIIAEEAMTHRGCERLRDALRAQPPWSAFPLLILSRRGTTGGARPPEEVTLSTLHNATYLERPLSAFSLVSAVRGMLESRRRQHEVRDLLRELSRRIRERDEFMAMLGHELRNPLGAVRNATQVLSREDAPASARSRAHRILDHQTVHLARLLDDLLDISRVTRGKIRLRTEPLDLRDAARHAAEIAATLFAERNQDFALELPERRLPVQGDPMRLEQVLSNLLGNAAKYTPAGGHVRLEAGFAGSERVELRVRDDGIGMDPATLEEVFEPFAQAAGSKEGLGLGLPLARHLIELHGGVLEAHSPGPGAGSEFVIRLPVEAADALPREVISGDGAKGGSAGPDGADPGGSWSSSSGRGDPDPMFPAGR